MINLMREFTQWYHYPYFLVFFSYFLILIYYIFLKLINEKAPILIESSSGFPGVERVELYLLIIILL